MKKQKRIAAAAALLCMFAAVLPACQPEQGTEQSSSSSQAQASTAGTQQAQGSQPSSGGQETQQAAAGLTDPNVNEPGTLPVVKEPIDLTIAVSQDTRVLDYENCYMAQWINERSNINMVFDFYPAKGDEARQKIELLVASDSELPEVILGIINETSRYNYGAAGALLDLREYYEKQGAFFQQACEAAGLDPEADLFRYVVSPDGGLYGMVSWGASLPNQYSNRAWINTAFLEKLGMDPPETTEEMYQFLKAVKEQDPNGNGRDDEIGIVGSTNAWNGNPLVWLLNQFIYMDNTDNRFLLKDGVLDVAYDKDEFRQGLQYARKLGDEGLLSSLSFTQDNAQYLTLVSAEEPVVAIGVSGGTGGFDKNLAIYDAIPTIQGPNGQKNVTWTPPVPSVNAYITKDCKHPEAAFGFLSLGYSDIDYSYIKRFGQEGTDWIRPQAGDKGLYEDLGFPATLKVLTNTWGVEEKVHWMATSLPNIEHCNIEAGLVVDVNDPNNLSTIRNAAAVKNMMQYAPKEAVVKIIYTAEETEETAELRATLRSYIKEAMVRFVVGDMNPEKDWDGYLKELDRLQYKKILEIDRQAYNRTMGKS